VNVLPIPVIVCAGAGYFDVKQGIHGAIIFLSIRGSILRSGCVFPPAV